MVESGMRSHRNAPKGKAGWVGVVPTAWGNAHHQQVTLLAPSPRLRLCFLSQSLLLFFLINCCEQLTLVPHSSDACELESGANVHTAAEEK